MQPFHQPNFLKHDAGHIVGAAELFSDNTARHAMAQENERLKKLALLDVLTEMGNRRYAEEHLDAMISESSRYSWPFGVLFADIDHFKQVNDIYGHAAGDAALITD